MANKFENNLSWNIAKNSGIILFGQIFALALNLVVMVFLARYLGETKFGILSFGIVFVSYFAIFADFGMKPIIVREIARGKANIGKLLGTGIITKSVLSIISLIFIILFSLIFDYSKEQIIVIIILAFTIFISSKLQTFRVVFETPFEANLKMGYPILFRLIDAIVLVLFLVIIFNFKFSLIQITFLYVISALVGFLLTLFFSIKYGKPDFRLDFKLGKWLILESLPLALYVSLSRLYTSADVFFLKMMEGDAAVGYYSAAFRLIYPLNFIPSAIVMSLFPLMSSYYTNSDDKLKKSFDFGVKILLLIGLALSLGTTFLGGRIIEILYTDKYSASIMPLTILMWAEFIIFLNFFLVDYNTSVNQQKRNIYAAIIMLIVNIPLNFIFISKWGIVGASIAKLVTVFLGLIFLIIYCRRNIGNTMLSIFLKSIPIVISFSVALFCLNKFNLVLIILLAPILFLLFVHIFRFFSPNERNVLRELILKLQRKK